jgi:hypothetical protein
MKSPLGEANPPDATVQDFSRNNPTLASLVDNTSYVLLRNRQRDTFHKERSRKQTALRIQEN